MVALANRCNMVEDNATCRPREDRVESWFIRRPFCGPSCVRVWVVAMGLVAVWVVAMRVVTMWSVTVLLPGQSPVERCVV